MIPSPKLDDRSFEDIVEEAIAMKDRCVFLDFITDQEENVYPMIPAGAGLNEMILV